VAEPESVVGEDHLGETGVDEYASAVCRFPGDIVAELATGVRLTRENDAWIHGTAGRLHISGPWQPDRGEGSVIRIWRDGEEMSEERVGSDVDPYACEIDTVAEHVAARQAPAPAMSWDDSLGQQRALTRWRDAIGLVYDQERPPAIPVARTGGHELHTRDDAPMIYGRIPGLDKDVSRLVFGCDNQHDLRHGFAVWDDWYERGGRAFDTGFIYGGGKLEANLGAWMEARGVRDEVAVIVKGAHHPHCYPDKLTEQLHISLERQRTDRADIYMMHRDNLEVPVGEFVDVMNEHVDAGRITVFGGSNWTIARVREANAYAAKHGKRGFSVLSNNLSLARMVDPVWKDCKHAHDAESREFLTETQTALMPWSSQARGFFLRADPAFTGDAELVRCWYAEDNFRRLERARELAEAKGVLPIQIALAWVLNQPYPTFPLIGPRQISETANCIQGLDIELSPEEVAWLDLQTETAPA